MLSECLSRPSANKKEKELKNSRWLYLFAEKKGNLKQGNVVFFKVKIILELLLMCKVKQWSMKRIENVTHCFWMF
jgi:hypothetical protein